MELFKNRGEQMSMAAKSRRHPVGEYNPTNNTTNHLAKGIAFQWIIPQRKQ
ncbi:MAG: hypothetical protein HRT74_03195 [Flavobacteriales bacterium]|nr:hypothetical protein [Flavobacteriales bacterium]